MVRALVPGSCVACLNAYAPGDEVGLLLEGWAHVDCWELLLEVELEREPPC